MLHLLIVRLLPSLPREFLRPLLALTHSSHSMQFVRNNQSSLILLPNLRLSHWTRRCVSKVFLCYPSGKLLYRLDAPTRNMIPVRDVCSSALLGFPRQWLPRRREDVPLPVGALLPAVLLLAGGNSRRLPRPRPHPGEQSCSTMCYFMPILHLLLRVGRPKYT